MAVNYTDVQKTEKYISRTNFDALEMAAVPEGTEFNIVDQIHESDLDSDVLQKLNNNAKINTANTFTAAQTFKKDITIEGNIIQNGSAYETHAEKLYTKNDMIYTRDGATAALADNAYTGIQAVKYDGTNDGQLVFGKDGVARVGDIGNTQPLATRAEAGNIVDKHLLQWDAAGQTLVDSGKSVSDLEGGGGDVTAAGSNIFTGLNSFRLNTTFGGTGESVSDPVITVDSGAIRFRYNGLFDCGQLVTDNASDKNLTYKYNDAVVKFPKKSGTIAIIGDLPVANPTAEGTVTLTKLKVGDVVYNIPSGGSGGVTSVTTSGTGNAVTAASISGNTLTLTKGSTFALITDIPNTSNFVTLSGAQTISGNKTFNSHISLRYGPEGYIDFGNGLKFQGDYVTKTANKTQTYSLWFPSNKTGSHTFAMLDDLPEANPAAAGTVTLTKLKVGDVVYTIPNGGSGGVTSVTTSGTGNAVTAASISGNTLTLTKGSTFLTSHQSLDSCAKLSGDNTFTGNNTFKTQDVNPVVTIKQDESNLTVLSGRKLEIFDSIGGEANKKRYNAKYMGNCIIHDVIDYSGEQSKVNSMKLRFPEKEGANAFTLATTDDIPISSATLSDNGTTLTLVLK